MGVYVKDLDMPSNCVECKLPYEICGYSYRTDIRLRHERHENCPLVEVKEPHGDLVDRDAILSFIDAGHLSNLATKSWNDTEVVDMLESRPTVIEAEGKDDD